MKLLDFGLARPQIGETNITNDGMIVGTPMYMAPEQATGEPLDGRSDLFSLGCVLYQMLTGRPPFEGSTALAVLSAVVMRSPRAVNELNPAVPTLLIDLLDRLLAKEPSGRPTSAEAVARELQALTCVSSDRPAHADRPSSGNQPQAAATPMPESSVLMTATRRRAREAERRQVTLLVCGCDLFESEAYLGLETEDQAQALRTFQQTCEPVMRQFDGTVVQCNEQGLIASFGYPVAHEDAARRAAEAGHRLLQEVKTVGSQFFRAPFPEAEPWVGLHTGPAIVEVKEDAVSLVGEVRNIAVRLKDLAEPGQVVCTDATCRLFRDRLQCTSLGEKRIKGLTKPVTLLRVERAAPIESNFGFTPAELSPLTGRDHEINLLKDRWEQVQDGMGQVVLITGEPGLGKSRLALTLKEHVLGQRGESDADAPVIEWRCSPHCRNTGLRPAIEFLERSLGFRSDDQPNDRFDRLLSRLAAYGLDRPELVPLWASLLSLPAPDRFPPLSLPPARQREETFRLMLEWLRVRAARSPILLVVEDLHWADASTLEFLGQVVAEFPRERILAVFTGRPEFKPPWAAADHSTSLALTRLTRRQAGDLIRKKAGSDVSDAVVEQLYDKTGGVPLFVEEFTKMLRESSARGAGLGHEIPSTLQDLVMARLDRMEGGLELAQLAAVLGREFSHELLATVAGTDPTILQADLTRLTQADILYAKGRAPRCTYIFKHALLEDALYNALMKSRRQEHHRRIGETLESRFPETVEAQPELPGRNFTEAGLTEKAAGYWLKAVRRARDRSAFTEAIGHSNQGLALVAALPESRQRDELEMQFLMGLAPSYIAARGYAAPEAGPVLVRALELCQRIGETPQQLGIMLGMWEWHVVRGDLRACPGLAADGMALAERSGDPGMMMEALFMPGVTLFYRGQFAGARSRFENALAEYDDRGRTKFWTAHTGHDAGVTHRCYLALTLWHLGYPDQAHELARRTHELAQEIDHAFSLEHAIDFAAFLAHYCRLGHEVQARGEEEIAIATEQAFPFWHALGTLHKGTGLLQQGRKEESLPYLLKGASAFRGTGAELRVPSYLGLLGDAYTQLGRFADAHQALNEGLAVAEKNDERCHEAELHRLRGELLLAESPGGWSEAEDCFSRAIETARQQQSKGWELRATTSLARLWQQQGRTAEARAALTAIYGAYTEGFSTSDLVKAKRLLATLV